MVDMGWVGCGVFGLLLCCFRAFLASFGCAFLLFPLVEI